MNSKHYCMLCRFLRDNFFSFLEQRIILEPISGPVRQSTPLSPSRFVVIDHIHLHHHLMRFSLKNML